MTRREARSGVAWFSLMLLVPGGAAHASDRSFWVHELTLGPQLANPATRNIQAGLDQFGEYKASPGASARYGLYKVWELKRSNIELGVRTGVEHFQAAFSHWCQTEWSDTNCVDVKGGFARVFAIPVDIVLGFPFIWPTFSGEPFAIQTTIFGGPGFWHREAQPSIVDFPGGSSRIPGISGWGRQSQFGMSFSMFGPRTAKGLELEILRVANGGPAGYSAGVYFHYPLWVKVQRGR
ncbi:MAG: hypothetical protein HY554_03065 [Elusimicrobia bacterium]|nr:hypothetical protein [Elusimicrobiota bacterium]